MSNTGTRYQKGTLKKVGDFWVLRLRHDDAGEGGAVIRRERSHRIARISEVRSESQARALADVVAERITGRRLNAGASILAADYLRRYMAEHLITKKPASIATITSQIRRHLLPGVGRLRIEQVTNRTAQQIVSTMLGEGYHPTTVGLVIRLMTTIMHKARADGFACDPIQRRALSMPSKVQADVERQTFNAEEVVRLVAESPMPWRLAYALQGTLGLRCAEVLGLAWRDFEDTTVRIRRSVVRGRIQSLKSKESARLMALPLELKPLLAEHRSVWAKNEDQLLFATADGKPVRDGFYRAQLHNDLRRLGIPRRGTHAFRHFVATHLLRAGKGVSATRDHMRHTSVSTTNTYAHAMPGDMQDIANYMGGLIATSAARNADKCGDAHQASAGK